MYALANEWKNIGQLMISIGQRAWDWKKLIAQNFIPALILSTQLSCCIEAWKKSSELCDEQEGIGRAINRWKKSHRWFTSQKFSSYTALVT